MGTEYYLMMKNPYFESNILSEPEYCKLRIGKSSHGWKFALFLHEYEEIFGINCWINRILNTGNSGEFIIDEYGTDIEPEDMIDIITKREKYALSFVEGYKVLRSSFFDPLDDRLDYLCSIYESDHFYYAN